MSHTEGHPEEIKKLIDNFNRRTPVVPTVNCDYQSAQCPVYLYGLCNLRKEGMKLSKLNEKLWGEAVVSSDDTKAQQTSEKLEKLVSGNCALEEVVGANFANYYLNAQGNRRHVIGWILHTLINPNGTLPPER